MIFFQANINVRTWPVAGQRRFPARFERLVRPPGAVFHVRARLRTSGAAAAASLIEKSTEEIAVITLLYYTY